MDLNLGLTKWKNKSNCHDPIHQKNKKKKVTILLPLRLQLKKHLNLAGCFTDSNQSLTLAIVQSIQCHSNGKQSKPLSLFSLFLFNLNFHIKSIITLFVYVGFCIGNPIQEQRWIPKFSTKYHSVWKASMGLKKADGKLLLLTTNPCYEVYYFSIVLPDFLISRICLIWIGKPDQSQAAEFPRDFLGIAMPEQPNKHYFILKGQKLVIEADSSIQTIMEKLQSYKLRVGLYFEVCTLSLVCLGFVLLWDCF